MRFIDIIHINYTKRYNIQSFFLPSCRCDFEKSILSSGQKLVDADPEGTLDSCSGTQNEQKTTQNNIFEAETRTLSG